MCVCVWLGNKYLGQSQPSKSESESNICATFMVFESTCCGAAFTALNPYIMTRTFKAKVKNLGEIVPEIKLTIY